jgi:hypothetical protein
MQSSPLPVALVAVVDARLPAARARSLQAGLLKLGRAAGDADILAQLHLQGFVLPDRPGHNSSP